MKTLTRWMRGLGCACALGLVGCSPSGSEPPKAPQIAPDIFGDLGDVVPFATQEQRESFERGRQVVLRRFTPEEGLGPAFNVASCVNCHEKPVVGGGAGRYRNFLLVGQTLPDGSFVNTGVNGVQPHFTLDGVRRPTDAATNTLATRNPIPFFGVGLLAEIPDEVILRNADPDDADGDGISGRPNYDRGFVGRFGRKSQTVSIEGFIRGPVFNHMGITSNPLSEAAKARLPVPSALDGLPDTTQSADGLRTVRQAQAAAPDEPTVDDDGVPDPEMSEQELFDLVSFSMLTAAPRPDAPTPASEAGQQLFATLRCDACHVPALEGPRGLIPLYSDLLLHDMGPELDDGIVMKLAGGSEFRTQPLWGIAAAGPYLHDGRADDLDEAIRLHGGEARRSREAYVALSLSEQAKVIAFLESLGGRAQRSDGMLPPEAPVPPTGDWGGPAVALNAQDQERFRQGQHLFDRDFGLREGVGPHFNGDSCRACHFDPVPGGAGGLDLDVTRQGIFVDGTFVYPTPGTMAHRHGPVDARPPLDPRSNFFERRQTPALFGLGLIERIPEALILANEDPGDADGDGVRGRAHRLADGRLGRFGWKANVPDVHEFVRDALSNELGLTLADEPARTFGTARDDDDVADPEVGLPTLETLTFYLSTLAPPPRTGARPDLDGAGLALFHDVGCAKCHVPSFPTPDGQTVRLYSDLLLHDVMRHGRRGVEDGPAGMYELRTPPLWGLAHTAPYLHDGAASTVAAAITLHGSEAEPSRRAYEALSPPERDALLAFLQTL
ncbi:di-heme oxidoredictase family protein [Corallococcus macrosporus]|uniref:Cytochrome c domain-containing protein n=1 Tax=Corallococcus macrosporus DSM 14697 TaxID=1189310 RepID=A0A250JYI6_9BACT|nr:di-heme oxidoredictase family protein [Corallococcus macrosporus]ATB48532.1 hypothetical protein MYMAC_004159 [Corallococcus macrosporus DSM 14697]